jgi:GIY-YIG catalytic domain
MDWTKINLSNLPSLPLNKKRELPALEAIYFCVIGQEILYIGQSKNVNQRWRNHHRYCELVTREDVEIYWFECIGIKQRLMAEQSLIRHYKPAFNSSPIRLKIALDDGNRLHAQSCVYLSPQRWQSVKLHKKLFDEMINRFKLRLLSDFGDQHRKRF